jgi:hypothetical protein
MILNHHPDFNPENTRWKNLVSRKALGYWCSKYEPNLPNPKDYVDVNWDVNERSKVIAYLKNGKRFMSWRGFSSCRMCKLWRNGADCLTDGTYIWPEGFAHYLEEHNVKPPDEFIKYVLSMSK